MRLTLFVLALLRLSACGAEEPVRSAAAFNDFIQGDRHGQVPFSLTGLVYHVADNSMIVRDPSGRAFIHATSRKLIPRPGTRAAIQGQLNLSKTGMPWAYAQAVTVLGHEAPPPFEPFKLDQLDSADNGLRKVVVEATLIRAFDDDIDRSNRFLLIKDGETLMPVAVPRDDAFDPERLVDAVIRVKGVYHLFVEGDRLFSGPFINVSDAHDITVVTPPPADPFDAPRLPKKPFLSPGKIAKLGKCSVRGTVTAAWGGNRLLIREAEGRTVDVELAEGARLPACGASGVVVGYPETDLIRISLVGARFRPEAAAAMPEETPEEVDFTATDVADLLGLHGHLVRVRGILRSIPSPGAVEQRLILDCGRRNVYVDFSAVPAAIADLQIGSSLEVTERCFIDSDHWRANNIIPRIKGFCVILRAPSDIRILARPSWWTAGRLLTVIGGLVLSLIGTAVWTMTLRHLVRKRSRELYRSQIETLRSDVRLNERTRLAVELHDTISQTLSGASMRVDAAQAFIGGGKTAKAVTCLGVASRTLVSCRKDLRRCIWDLRNRILDETDVEEAIRKTVQPQVDKARVTVHFGVPRPQISDNAFNTVLSVIRELVANAVFHGKADEIRVEGSLADGMLRFSVSDNGTGFDPEDRPGVSEGHFGLQGVHERLATLGGGMSIDSAIGEGTRISLWIRSLS